MRPSMSWRCTRESLPLAVWMVSLKRGDCISKGLKATGLIALTQGICASSGRNGMRRSRASASKICADPAFEMKRGALKPVILSLIFCWKPRTIAKVKELTNIASAILTTEIRSTGLDTRSPRCFWRISLEDMKRSNDNLIYLQVQKYTKVLASIALL